MLVRRLTPKAVGKGLGNLVALNRMLHHAHPENGLNQSAKRPAFYLPAQQADKARTEERDRRRHWDRCEFHL